MFFDSKSEIDYKKQGPFSIEYEAFFKRNPVPMFIYNSETLKFLDVNLATMAKYGYSYDELLSMTVEDIRPQEDIKKLHQMFEANPSKSRVTGYWRHKKKDGTIIFVDVYSHKIEFQSCKDARFVTAFDVTGRKNAEENLSKSEQRFRDLAELLPQIVFEFDLEGRLLYANQLAFDTFQYPYSTDISTINIFNFLSPSQLDFAKKDLSKILKGKKIENREYVLYKNDGTFFTGVVIASPIIQNNLPIGFRGVIIDVSEIKHIHKELLFSQKKYSSLFENANSIMTIVDPESGQYVDMNKAASDYYGYPLEKFRKMYIFDIVALPENEIRATIKKAMSFQENQFVRMHKLANGTRRFVEVFTSPIFINGKNFLFSVIHDINDRILAEENVKKLNKAIEQSPVSVVITDRDGNIEYVNPKFCEVTSYTSEEAVGKNPRILKSGEQSDDYYKALWETLSAGKTWYGEFKNKKKDGSFYWESASISPVFDEEGNLTHYVAIKEDITERKIKEKELLRAKEAAEESSRVKSSFLANMSHELRTPLVGILGYADILSGELLDKEHKDMAETILQSGQQLIETLNSILDLSRIEANRTEIEIKTYDLRDILNDCHSLFKQAAKNKNLYLKINIPPKNLFVDTDSQLLRKVFNNLLNNAIKFTTKGGITITAETILIDNKLQILTKVADTGIGIPEQYQDLIFEPFRQVSEGLSRNFTGSGLGLTLTKKFVDLLQGTISVSSKEGQGTTFTVTLPFSHTRPQSLTESVKNINAEDIDLNNKPSILLVEDDQVNAQIVCAYLNPYFTIKHVLDGQTAIKCCQTEEYDAILMDIALKGISGTVAMQEIKKLKGRNSEIPIIAITAYAMLGDKESFLKAGFSHYISKPFSRSQLFELLIHIFGSAN
jgi:PAS domain S-box-containing protein